MISLAFYDHQRQSYASCVPMREPHAVGEFMIGDYSHGDLELHDGGEFALILYDFTANHFLGATPRPRRLSVQVQAFGDAIGSLRAFLELGAVETIEAGEIATCDDLARILLRLGLRDFSDAPLGAGVEA